MDYQRLITEALKITWKYKFLWLFGFFMGGGLNYNFGPNFNFNNSDFDGDNVPDVEAEKIIREITGWLVDNLILIAALILLFFLIAIVFIILRVISQGAVVWSVAQIEKGDPPAFSTALKAGISFFWRVFGLFALLFLFTLILFLIFFLPLILAVISIFTGGAMVAIPIMILLFFSLLLLAIPVILLINLISMLSLRFIVIAEQGIIQSLRSAFKLFRRNPGTTLLAWLISVALGIAFGIGFLVIIFLIFFPVVIGFIISFSFGFSLTKIIIALGVGLILAIFINFLAGIGQVYFSAYWTLAWQELVDIGVPAETPDQS